MPPYPLPGGIVMKTHVCFLIAEHPFLDARIFKKQAKSLMKIGLQARKIIERTYA